jgi:hypothetical protein
MASGCALCTPLPDRCFSLSRWPSFSQAFDQLLHAGGFAPWPHHLQRLFKLLPGRKELAPGRQKHQIRVPDLRQCRFSANPKDPCLLLGSFARRISFGSIALPAFVLLHPGLRDQQAAIEKLADGIGQIPMRFALKQRADGEGSRQGRGYLGGGSKREADITAPLPGQPPDDIRGTTGVVLPSDCHSGCRVGRFSPVLKLLIHPEMLSPAILNRSMPRTAASGMLCPLWVSLNASVANFHLLKISILGGQAHLRVNQPFLFEPWGHNSIMGSDSVEPSVYLPLNW